MAKVQSNLVIHGLSGMLGKQVVIRRQKNGGYVVASAPGRRGGSLSGAQKAHLERFRQAVLYAKSAQKLPEYVELAHARGQTAYVVAVTDFLKAPEVQRVDVGAYRGEAGQTIAVTAVDDVRVKSVTVAIQTDDGTVVERGSAVLSASDANQWLYTTTASAPTSAVTVVVEAMDLAGHLATSTVHA